MLGTSQGKGMTGQRKIWGTLQHKVEQFYFFEKSLFDVCSEMFLGRKSNKMGPAQLLVWLYLLFREAISTVKSWKFQMFSGYTHKPNRNVVIGHVGSSGSQVYYN